MEAFVGHWTSSEEMRTNENNCTSFENTTPVVDLVVTKTSETTADVAMGFSLYSFDYKGRLSGATLHDASGRLDSGSTNVYFAIDSADFHVSGADTGTFEAHGHESMDYSTTGEAMPDCGFVATAKMTRQAN